MLNASEKLRLQEIDSTFLTQYGRAAEVVLRAPGRVNLIGEHTDYNDGYVLPAAIERSMLIACSPRTDGKVQAFAVNYNYSTLFSIDGVQPTSDTRERWSNYLRAMAWVMKRENFDFAGADCVIQGDVPLGSGLSSSAAMLVASGLMFATLAGSTIDPVKLALLAQQAEREFVGVNVGIMDQYISSLGKANHALLIDTRSLTYKAVPLPETGVSMVIADTNKKRGLVDSEYNTRRSECEQAVVILKQTYPEITALRDVSVAQLAAVEEQLPAPVRQRARHVVTENQRTLDMADALEAGDLARCGELMNQSHESLARDYAVSCRELDELVGAARSIPGVYGARMTGAGFGGCTISLVADTALEEFSQRVPALYNDATGLEAVLTVTRAAQGAERVR